jgi:formylglycine-generating enzyme required for sulfatase activity
MERVILGGGWQSLLNFCISSSVEVYDRLINVRPVSQGARSCVRVPHGECVVSIIKEAKMTTKSKKSTKKAVSEPVDESDAILEKDGSKMLPIGTDKDGNALYLAETPVTWGQYLKFCDDTGYPYPEMPGFFSNIELLAGVNKDHPVVNISFIDAMNYCHHYGLDLPTEDEWLLAAKHPNGNYPWGSDEPSAEHLNCAEYGPSRTTPVKNYPLGRGKFGHYDLAGNVWEWCRNKEDKPSDFVDPTGPLGKK